MKLTQRQRTWLISSCFLLAGIIIYLILILPLQKNYYSRHVSIRGTYLLTPITINNFDLTDQHGNSLTKENLKNHWSMLFFGFTSL